MNKLNTITLVALLVLFTSSCASIVSKTNYPVTISSNPSAKVTVTDDKGTVIFQGNTPSVVTLKSGAGFFKKATYQVKFQKAGYDEKIVPVTFKMDGWYWGNLLVGGIIGMLIVDPATGAMFKLKDDYINETLTSSTAAAGEDGLQIYGIDDIPEAWKAHLEEVKK